MDRAESLPHFCGRGHCHCHPAQMVGWAGGSALGSQELYPVRTSASLEFKVQGQEICGEGSAGEHPRLVPDICRPTYSDAQVVEHPSWALTTCRFHMVKHLRDPRWDGA